MSVYRGRGVTNVRRCLMNVCRETGIEVSLMSVHRRCGMRHGKCDTRRALIFVLAISLGSIAGAREARAEDTPSSALSFLVLKDYNGKPVRNAAVVLHPVNTHGKQQRGGFELKTDGDGKTHFEGVPYGKMRVQVLAPGFQTFGEDYDVESPTMEIMVKLKLPQKQYSIYDGQPGEQKKDDAPEKK
jgi:hypothetical protein